MLIFLKKLFNFRRKFEQFNYIYIYIGIDHEGHLSLDVWKYEFIILFFEENSALVFFMHTINLYFKKKISPIRII
jgi:hypothetical protein